MLRSLGVGKGDRVFTIMGRIPELYVAMLGALRNGCVVSPLFSAFGPEPIATRVNIGEADRAGDDGGDLRAQDRQDSRSADIGAPHPTGPESADE